MLACGVGCAERIRVSEHFGFPLEVNLCIDIGRIDGDVAEPGADGVDVDTGAQQVRGRRVSDRVRADWSAKQGRV